VSYPTSPISPFVLDSRTILLDFLIPQYDGQLACFRLILRSPLYRALRAREYPRAHAGHSHSHTVKTGANALIESVKFDAKGLVSAVAQQVDTNDVLMVAWMNEEAIRATLKEGRAVYFSRSRQKLWRKGEESGNVQHIHEVLLDCDGDCLLLKVDQIGPACHTGRLSCFYRAVQEDKPLLDRCVSGR